MQDKNHIHKVAIVGAGGNCGKFMVESLLGTGKHVVTAVTRVDSTSKLPEGVQVKKVDYENQSSLVEALRGQDALIITMGVTAPKDQVTKLLDAAAEANVPWILPNDWGADPTHEAMCKDIFIADAKQKDREYISKLGKSSWVSVITGFWYEWSLGISLAYGFDFANKAVTLYDEGETRMTTSTWPQVGRAVASLLSLKIHPDGDGDTSPCLDNFKDSYCYVASFTVTQKDMLESVLRVTQTSIDDWTVTKEPVKSRYAAGVEQMQKGDRMGFGKMLYARLFYPDGCGDFEKSKGLHNDVLGLPKENIDEFTEIAIERSKMSPWG